MNGAIAGAGIRPRHVFTSDASVNALPPRAVALWALVVILYALPLVVNLPLIDPDEGLHSAIATEMVDRGDYVIPRFLGQPFLDKPILFFFMQAVSLRTFGQNEFAIRLPGQAFGFLGAVTTGLLGAALAGRQAGIVAACIQATLALPLALNQAAVHDVALVPWTNLAFLSFMLAMRGQATSRVVLGWCAAAGLWLGLAMLTKGLTGIALVGLPIAVLAVIERRLSWWLMLGALVSLVIAVALSSPWYLAMERAVPGYLHYFFIERHYLGFSTTTQLHGDRPWWYYAPVVITGSVPWIPTILGTRKAPNTQSALKSLLQTGLIWFAVDFVFLSSAGSKLVTYVLPLFPAMALLLAVAWLAAAVRDAATPPPAFARLIAAHAIAGALALPVLGLWAVTLGSVYLSSLSWIGVASAVVVWLWVAYTARKSPIARSFRWSLRAVAVTLVAAYLTVFPAMARRYTARDLARHFNARQTLPPRLWIVDERVGSFLFYLDPALRRHVSADTVEGVTVGEALIQGTAVPGTLLAVPEDVVTRLSRNANLAAVPSRQAGRYRIYDARQLRYASPIRR